MTSSLLTATQLVCYRQQRSLFAPISFSLRAGEALLVEGGNGAGKSSLLRLIAGIATPAGGELQWQGQSLKADLHYIGHSHGIRLGLTVTENILLAGELAEQRITEIDPILTRLLLSAEKNTPVQYLSAGQKRRVALAKLFLIPKILWVLDEPLTSLDITTQHLLLEKINQHQQLGGMCIMTSHQPVTLSNMQRLEVQPC
jgi:heme exporter protein A